MLTRWSTWWRRSRWEWRLYVLAQSLERATLPQHMGVLAVLASSYSHLGAARSARIVAELARELGRELAPFKPTVLE